jgi:hypothetical protein
MRNREQREAKALQLLRRWPDASALDIGIAAVQGESRAFAIPRKAKAAIGLSIAVELVRRKLAKPTKDNRFAVAIRSLAGANKKVGAPTSKLVRSVAGAAP